MALGVCPQVFLGEAREHREAAKKQLSNGIDPSVAKQENKRQNALNAENTFEAVGREYTAPRHKLVFCVPSGCDRIAARRT